MLRASFPSIDMDQSARDDPKLREVKAVLSHLQGLPSADLPPAEPEPPLRGRRVGTAGILIAVAVGLVVAGLAAVPSLRQLATSALQGATTPTEDGKPGDTSTTTTTVAKTEPGGNAKKTDPGSKLAAAKAAVENAVALMNSGQVQAARKRLLAFADDGSPDVLWALARSYDPTVLAEIPAADAVSNVPEAERWYRAWHAAAVEQKLVNDSGASVEKIIKSMQGSR
jgi:hypothetical protein